MVKVTCPQDAKAWIPSDAMKYWSENCTFNFTWKDWDRGRFVLLQEPLNLGHWVLLLWQQLGRSPKFNHTGLILQKMKAYAAICSSHGWHIVRFAFSLGWKGKQLNILPWCHTQQFYLSMLNATEPQELLFQNHSLGKLLISTLESGEY